MDLYIIGAGDVGGFLAYHASEMSNCKVAGFLDDNVSKHGNSYCGFKVVGAVDYLFKLDTPVAVAIAIADPIIKRRIVAKLDMIHGIKFPSFVHPTAWLGKNVDIQKGAIIYPGVTVNYETLVEEFVTINMNAAIGHNCNLRRYGTISPGVNLGGFTSVGECSLLGIGASSIQGITIGEEAIVGGMTMLIRNVPNNVTVVGIPGRIVKNR